MSGSIIKQDVFKVPSKILEIVPSPKDKFGNLLYKGVYKIYALVGKFTLENVNFFFVWTKGFSLLIFFFFTQHCKLQRRGLIRINFASNLVHTLIYLAYSDFSFPVPMTPSMECKIPQLPQLF